MSLFNPGKRGILTVIALMLIVGVPGVIAYADDSDDVYYTEFETTEPVKMVKVVGSSTNSFGVTATGSAGSYDIIVDDANASNTVNYVDLLTDSASLVLSSTEIEPTASKIVFDTDLKVTDVAFAFYSNNDEIAEFDMELNSSDLWEVKISSVDALSLENANYVRFVLTFDDEAEVDQATVQEFSVSYQMYTPNDIFTDDVVELIVMLGGIALLICGTFALSFIDVNTPGKAVSYAKRGIRSAGNKMRRGKK